MKIPVILLLLLKIIGYRVDEFLKIISEIFVLERII